MDRTLLLQALLAVFLFGAILGWTVALVAVASAYHSLDLAGVLLHEGTQAGFQAVAAASLFLLGRRAVKTWTTLSDIRARRSGLATGT